MNSSPARPLRFGEELNFLLTNRIPRIAATRLLGWYSRIRSPLLARVSIALWRRFGDLDLSDSAPRQFVSVHDCFTRALRPGSRPLDCAREALISPSDGIVGACGQLAGIEALQAKGLYYPLPELLGSAALAARYRDGVYATLRLTAGMYHRFHAPADGRIERIIHIAGDTWNVNPPAVLRVPKLYCRNERAVLEFRPDGVPLNAPLLLVPVAAVGVAGLRLHAIADRLGLGYRGPAEIACDARYRKGGELGWFEQGSTIIVLAPRGYQLDGAIETGARIRMGMRLLLAPKAPATASQGAGARPTP
jgi:phosphatidylserine decarboxylase